MKGKILIVDDEQSIRALLRDVLGQEYELAEADSGAALQKCLTQEEPDVVLLDVNLGDANGLELLPQVKRRWPESPVIVLTGAPSEHEAVSWAVDATKRGAFNFVRKSAEFDIEKLSQRNKSF